MNDFLQHCALLCHESDTAKTFLAIDSADNKTIVGFYSPAPGGLRPTRRSRFAAASPARGA
jgi:hypothetical protein